MPASLDALFAFLLAGIVALLLVPLTDRLARRVGAIDHPNERSLHVAPTPKLGGLAILVAVLITGLIWLPWDGETRAILIGALMITAVGFLDDIYDLNAAVKLAGQTASVIVPVAAGVTVESFTFPFLGALDPGSVDLIGLPGPGSIDLGDIGTVVGIVAVINVINLIDGVDGLAAGVCTISGVTLAVIALSLERNAAGSAGGADRGGLARVPPPRLPAGDDLHGGHRVQPARVPARGSSRSRAL